MRDLFQWLCRHWQEILALALACRIAWSLKNNEDLREHRGFLWFGFIAVIGSFVIGMMLGATTGKPFIGWCTGAVLMLVPLYYLSRTADRAFKDMLGGFVFEMIFAEGSFGETPHQLKKLPNVTLLRHWRENGQVRRAYWQARRNLIGEERAFPLWLFAAETAALYRNDVRLAERIIRRLFRCPAFSADQRDFALLALKGWAATGGVHIDSSRFTANTPPPKTDALKVADRLRQSGFYQEAQTKLELLLTREPENLAAGLLLMRVHAQDLQQPKKAERLLKQLAAQPFTSDAYVEFAKRSISSWSRMTPDTIARKRSWWARRTRKPAEPTAAPVKFRVRGYAGPNGAATAGATAAPANLTHSVDELIQSGHLDTALNEAERQIQMQPDNFENWAKLLTILTEHTGSLKRAGKVVAEIQRQAAFTDAQKKRAIQMLDKAETQQHSRKTY